MCHRAGVLNWPTVMPSIAKYVFHYLFAQAEFGLLSPVNLTDSSSELIHRFGSDDLRERFLERMWSQDPEALLKCAQFMTEKASGSDVRTAELTAVRDGGVWRLWGDKWFCSNVDAWSASPSGPGLAAVKSGSLRSRAYYNRNRGRVRTKRDLQHQ